MKTALVVIVSTFLISFITGCKTSDEVLIKPTAIIKPAINVTITNATLVAEVTPNRDNTTVTFEYNFDADVTWKTNTLPGKYSGLSAKEVSIVLSDLRPNAQYNYRVKVSNQAGEVISGVGSFTTYAVADYDGNLYHTVTIGSQTWLKENLKTTHYANGDPIPNVTDFDTWFKLTSGAYCWYNNDPTIGEVYGALYNFYVGIDPRGLIKDWHVPAIEEWEKINDFYSYGAAGLKLIEAGNTHWKTTLVPGNNESGFTALPNGWIGVSGNVRMFSNIREEASFQSTSLFGGYADLVSIRRDNVFLSTQALWGKEGGSGIRLLKDGK